MKERRRQVRIPLEEDGPREAGLGEKLGCSFAVLVALLAAAWFMRSVIAGDRSAEQKRDDDIQRCADGGGTYFCSHSCVCFAPGVVLK